MEQIKFPGMSNISYKEGALMIKVLKQEGCAEAKKVMSFLEGIDDALTLQKTASIVDRFRGKRVGAKKSRDLIYDRLMQIDI